MLLLLLMKRRRLLFLIALCYGFLSEPALCQMGSKSLNPTGEQTVPLRIQKKNWDEIVSERTLHSSSFRKPDGTWVGYFSKELVNYYNTSGELVPVSTELCKTKNGWAVPSQPHEFSLTPSGELSVMLPNGESIIFSSSAEINNHKLSNGNAFIHGDTAQFFGQAPGIDKFIHFRLNGSKYSYIINNASSLSSGDMIVKEKLFLPDATDFLADPQLSEKRNDRIAGHLIALDKKGNELLRIASAFCYDASGSWTLAEYKFTRKGNEILLETIVPDSWLHDPARQFPLVIDPLVTGPTSTYPFQFMPSCFFPNYNVDSILVTVPPAITVNNLSVTGSYYADPWTTTTMADGRMYYSTACASSQVFTIAPPGGNTAGTAYLDDFNMRSPLMCCHPQQCSGYTFYLRMHISRTINGAGCNTTFLYYNPSTAWPFSAFIEGNTPESYSSQMVLFPSTLCANDCETSASLYARYGVPPYTFSHPWATSSVTQGTPSGCSSGSQVGNLTLNIPNCPDYCDPSTSLPVPAATITDACGNTVTGLPILSLTIAPIAQASANPSSAIICSGENVNMNLSACLPGATINWFGNGLSGTGNITDTTFTNTGSSIISADYSAFVTMNGCTSDTITINVAVEPQPNADFSTTPSPVFITQSTTFNDIVTSPGTIINYYWDFGDGTTASVQNPAHIYTAPGEYVVCFSIMTSTGCIDTICKTISVLPLEIIPPNVFSPNGDGQNDALVFPYLEFYASNTLSVFNRWGQTIFEKSNYQNDWKAEGYPDGVYFFVLTAGDQKYNGTVHVIRH